MIVTVDLGRDARWALGPNADRMQGFMLYVESGEDHIGLNLSWEALEALKRLLDNSI